jgi:hypothetical protein
MIKSFSCASGAHVEVHRPRSWMRTPLTRNSNIISGGVTRAKVSNFLENFKTDILSTLTTQVNVLQDK